MLSQTITLHGTKSYEMSRIQGPLCISVILSYTHDNKEVINLVCRKQGLRCIYFGFPKFRRKAVCRTFWLVRHLMPTCTAFFIVSWFHHSPCSIYLNTMLCSRISATNNCMGKWGTTLGPDRLWSLMLTLPSESQTESSSKPCWRTVPLRFDEWICLTYLLKNQWNEEYPRSKHFPVRFSIHLVLKEVILLIADW